VELVLHVLDASDLWTPEDTAHLEEFAGKKRILIRNKIDLRARMEMPPGIGSRVIDVSCVSGQGIEPLKDSIKELVWAGELQAGMLQVMINSRHQEALNRAREATRRTIEAMDGGAPLDLVAIDLRIATGAVGEIVGKTATEDLLDSIFSQFCIGK
jgi:tRNA modification GTPase